MKTPLPPTPDGRYRRDDALAVANEIVAMIADTCERITIAGSIRREKPNVKDVEIVVLPHDAARYRARLDKLVHSGQVEKARYGQPGKQSNRWGPDYRGLLYRGIKIELFTATPDSWGYQLWLRTGPGEANTYCMMHLQGAAGIRCRGGHVWDVLDEAPRKLHVPDEETMFALWRLPYFRPAARSEQTYRAQEYRPRKPYGKRIPAQVKDNTPPAQTSLF